MRLASTVTVPSPRDSLQRRRVMQALPQQVANVATLKFMLQEPAGVGLLRGFARRQLCPELVDFYLVIRMYKRVISRLIRMVGSHFRKELMLQQSTRRVQERLIREASSRAAQARAEGEQAEDGPGAVRLAAADASRSSAVSTDTGDGSTLYFDNADAQNRSLEQSKAMREKQKARQKAQSAAIRRVMTLSGDQGKWARGKAGGGGSMSSISSSSSSKDADANDSLILDGQGADGQGQAAATSESRPQDGSIAQVPGEHVVDRNSSVLEDMPNLRAWKSSREVGDA